MGARTVIFRRHADGDQVFHAAFVVRHQRPDPTHADALPLAKHCATSAIIIVLSVLIAYLSTPSPENARTGGILWHQI